MLIQGRCDGVASSALPSTGPAATRAAIRRGPTDRTAASVKSSWSTVITDRRNQAVWLLMLLLLLLQPSGGFSDAVAIVVFAPRSISDAVRRCHGDRVVPCISAGSCSVNASLVVTVDILMDLDSSSSSSSSPTR